MGSGKPSLSCGVSALLLPLQAKRSLRRQEGMRPPLSAGRAPGVRGGRAGPRGTRVLYCNLPIWRASLRGGFTGLRVSGWGGGLHGALQKMTLPSPTILQSAGGCNTTGLLTERS